ncbi:MAG: GNAT family N-acetyltransferase [Saprospiraceae bacterium]|nr:GNAT family N-acetyltransferase [Saprospiraceae bacterium]
MQNSNQPLAHQILFEANGFTAEMCIEEESLRLAYNLRYRAYRSVDAIPANAREIFTDRYDAQENVRTYLIWHEGQAVASVRSLTWSSAYNWAPTDSIVLFKNDIDQQLGLNTPVLESNRYVVDPEFKGRKSLMAQMLLFRIQALGAQIDNCKHVITAVRPRHASFYQRFMNFEPISQEITVEKVSFPIQLLATPVSSCEKLAKSSALAAHEAADLERYRNCLATLNHRKDPLKVA